MVLEEGINKRRGVNETELGLTDMLVSIVEDRYEGSKERSMETILRNISEV